MKLDEKSLWKNIKSGTFLPVYLIVGDENYLKQKYANLLADSVVPAGLETFNVHKLKGEDTSVEEIVDCVEALPAMCEQSVVLVHDLDFGSLDNSDDLIALLSDLPSSCVLIFWQDTKAFSKKTNACKEMWKLIEKAGAVCELNKRSSGELLKFVRGESQKRGCSMTEEVATYLISSVGEDMSCLLNEIDKLCAFCPGMITIPAIDKICVKSVEANTFDMIDAMLVNDFDRAFSLLSILFSQKTEPTMILGAMVSTYVDMYRAKLCETSGHKLSEVASLFPGTYKNDYRLKKALGRAKKYSLKSLALSLEILGKADFKLKSSFVDNKVVMEKLLIELAKARKVK